MDGSFELFTATHEQAQSNRACSISRQLCSAFFIDPSYTLSICYLQLHCLCSVAAVKRLPVLSVRTVIQSNLWWSLSTANVLFYNYHSKIVLFYILALLLQDDSTILALLKHRIVFNHPKDMLPAFCVTCAFLGVLSVICRLHNRKLPVQIPFSLVRPLFSRLGHKHFFRHGDHTQLVMEWCVCTEL